MTFDLIVQFHSITIDPGPYYGGDSLSGKVNAVFINEGEIDLYSSVRFKVQLWESTGIFIGEKDMWYPQQLVYGSDSGNPPTEDIQYDWSFDATPPGPGWYYIKIVRMTTGDGSDQTDQFKIDVLPSDKKEMLGFVFAHIDNPVLNVNVYAVWNETTARYEAIVPDGTVVTALVPLIYISHNATIVPSSGVARDFTATVQYVITAEDETSKAWFVNVGFAPPANLFIYDNSFTNIIPDKAERGQLINYDVFISNSGLTTSQGDEVLTVTLHDSENNYVLVVAETIISSIAPFIDVLVEGQFTIAMDVPLGSDIDYMLSFHLNNSLVDRHFIVSAWQISSRTIIWSKLISAFIGESTITPKMYALINKDFFTLHPDDNQFWYHSDNIIDGNIMFYNSEFLPYIEFYINKFEFEKVYDNIVIHAGSLGIRSIEYFTEDQNQIHIWPEEQVDPPQRPWIDPEFKEDKWYVPIHPEEITIGNDLSDVRKMRGTWMKVRITFKSLYKQYMKNVVTYFRLSKV